MLAQIRRVFFSRIINFVNVNHNNSAILILNNVIRTNLLLRYNTRAVLTVVLLIYYRYARPIEERHDILKSPVKEMLSGI